MAKQGQGVALDPPGAKPLDLKYMKIKEFPKAVGLWWVQGEPLALPAGGLFAEAIDTAATA